VITIEKQTLIPLFLNEFDLLTFYESIKVALQKKKSYPLLANADTVSNRN